MQAAGDTAGTSGVDQDPQTGITIAMLQVKPQ